MAAKKEVKEEVTEEVTEEVKKEKKGEKMVKITIPRYSKEERDVYVSINEQSWLIKRGVEVEVPWYVAELLENSRRQKEAADNFILANEK